MTVAETVRFGIDIVSSSCEVTVVVSGDIDLATACELDEHLRAVDRSDRDVVVDLAGVTFMDAAALRVLMLSHHRLQATGRGLTLSNVSGSLQRVLALAGLTDVFEMAVA